MNAIDLIDEERSRQIQDEGWTPEHDDGHQHGELAKAAACYATPEESRFMLGRHIWPWDEAWWKPEPHDRIRELVKAGALIVAEIDRLQRLAANSKNHV